MVNLPAKNFLSYKFPNMFFINISLVIHVRIGNSTQCCAVCKNIWIETLNLVHLILFFWCWKLLIMCGDDYGCSCTLTGCSKDLGNDANINLLLIRHLTMLQNLEIPWHFLASCSMSWIVSLAPLFFSSSNSFYGYLVDASRLSLFQSIQTND